MGTNDTNKYEYKRRNIRAIRIIRKDSYIGISIE